MIEVTTVADDEVVLFDGPAMTRFEHLAPDTDHDCDGVVVRTLPRPGGELLSRFATVNDVHFGETECGVMEGFELGPVFQSEEGEDPYPEVMNRGAIEQFNPAREERARKRPGGAPREGDDSCGRKRECRRVNERHERAFADGAR